MLLFMWLQLLILAASVVLTAIALGGRWSALVGYVLAGLLAVSGAALALYVASEDDYRRGGISRWEAYDAGRLTVAAILACAVAAAWLVAASRRRAVTGVAAASLVAAAAAGLTFFAFLANSVN